MEAPPQRVQVRRATARVEPVRKQHQHGYNSMADNLILAQNLNCEYVNFFLMMPYPGTKYYEEASMKNYPLPKTWNDYGFFAPSSVPMQTKYLTPTEIVRFRDFAFKNYFSSSGYQSLIKRKFGQETVDFINNEVLSREIERNDVY